MQGSALGDLIPFDESFKDQVPTLLEGGRIDTKETKDTYGWLLTQYEPVFGSDGKCVAYVGADISMQGVTDYVQGYFVQVAQIIAVADCFDAMYSNRPYRARMNFERVVSIITEVSGTQLTPKVVDAFMRLVEQGAFRAPDDTGGGTMESIENIHG